MSLDLQSGRYDNNKKTTDKNNIVDILVSKLMTFVLNLSPEQAPMNDLIA